MQLREIPINSLPRTSGRTIKRMESLGIHTYHDLVHYYPFRYEDYSKHLQIADIYSPDLVIRETNPEETLDLLSKNKYTIHGEIVSFTSVRTRRGFEMQKAVIKDESGKVDVTWFNQKYLQNVLRKGQEMTLSGYTKEYKGNLSFQPDEFEIGPQEQSLHTGRLVPIYPQTSGLSSKTIREKVFYVLQTYGHAIEESLPKDILKRFELVSDEEAYTHVHFSDTIKDLTAARNRIAFDELFIVQLSSHLIKKEWKEERVQHILDISSVQKNISSFKSSLPFNLTDAQERCTQEILLDMQEKHPMNRLLQGDVGSGKTVVAATAAYATHLHGYKTLIMAPTEILAQQHLQSLTKTFGNLPPQDQPRITLLTSKVKPSKQELEEATIVVGTHALISSKVDFTKVGLVVVDEQHKFGVVQRAKLKEKGAHPHLLSMTATPIPRTVTLTLYGELDVSIIDELPKGRKEIKTYVVDDKKREDAYDWTKKEISNKKAQVFVVCPLIEESESETMKSVKSVKVEYEKLQKIFESYSLGLLHGKLKKQEKDDILEQFADHTMDILVATPVVEVGIDIPDATIIMIETAERFGLAQLHQLRGRVGRNDKQSHCLLFTEKRDKGVLHRLNTFAKTHDGFKLAEYDLERRGAGNMYGTQQHGMADLHIASLLDLPLIEKTGKAVDAFMSHFELDDYPALHQSLQKYQIKHIARD